jgi:hypothetical protein
MKISRTTISRKLTNSSSVNYFWKWLIDSTLVPGVRRHHRQRHGVRAKPKFSGGYLLQSEQVVNEQWPDVLCEKSPKMETRSYLVTFNTYLFRQKVAQHLGSTFISFKQNCFKLTFTQMAWYRLVWLKWYIER